MKKISSVIFIFFVAVSVMMADTMLEYFKVRSNGNNITIEWKCLNELQIQGFELERSSDGHSYSRIETFTADGSGSSYTYVDKDPFLRDGDAEQNKTLSESTYSYRLKILKNDNTYTYSDEVYVKHELSSIRRTWGMIKEMFR